MFVYLIKVYFGGDQQWVNYDWLIIPINGIQL